MSIHFRYSNNSYFRQSFRYLKNDKNDRESVIKLHILKVFILLFPIDEILCTIVQRMMQTTIKHSLLFFLDKVIFPYVSHVYVYQIIVTIVHD